MAYRVKHWWVGYNGVRTGLRDSNPSFALDLPGIFKNYGTPLFYAADIVQDPLWMLETADSTEPYTYYDFSYPYYDKV